jgi:hypothetical protein
VSRFNYRSDRSAPLVFPMDTSSSSFWGRKVLVGRLAYSTPSRRHQGPFKGAFRLGAQVWRVAAMIGSAGKAVVAAIVGGARCDLETRVAAT